MTIEKGEPWGHPRALPADGVVVRSDAELRQLVTEARRKGEPLPTVGVLGGDLCRTIGGRGDEARLRTDSAMTLPIDLGSVLIDGRQYWFVAHLIARRGWWRGRIFAAMNAEYLGRWDVAPRGHPNDGHLETFDVTMGLADRLQARPRLPYGLHLPHPGIVERRHKAVQVEFDPPLSVWLDGEKVASGVRHLSVRVESDALSVVV